MRKPLVVLLSAVFLLSGCAVEMVRKTYSPVKGGTIRYSTGWFMAEKNRAKAMDEMNTYCSPAHVLLLAEDSKQEFTGQSYSNSSVNKNNVDTTTTQGQEGFVYLHFKCVKAR
ncbi:MAG TPA: hypothetical protein VF412_03295 [Bdellovibrio sp.]|uniref:hypothetical protein n=1 Tax=Bdellovibrio sp. TaxID=28201 RepID=UPI002F093DE9